MLNPLKREFYRIWKKSLTPGIEVFKNYNKNLLNATRMKLLQGVYDVIDFHCYY